MIFRRPTWLRFAPASSNVVQLLPVGKVDAALLETVRAEISYALPVSCELSPLTLDPNPSYHPERQQYHSSEILERMQPLVRAEQTRAEHWRLLAITAVDLYIPILKYVFGEAQMGGPCALVSYHRLHQEFYGLERDEALLAQRLAKECVHELGHTLGLHHCQDYRCAMASAHSVEWIDLREDSLCESCRSKAESFLSAGVSR
ncbi:MAG: archaemetzincin [Candidatus Sulfotelmatobacter sp.]